MAEDDVVSENVPRQGWWVSEFGVYYLSRDSVRKDGRLKSGRLSGKLGGFTWNLSEGEVVEGIGPVDVGGWTRGTKVLTERGQNDRCLVGHWRRTGGCGTGGVRSAEGGGDEPSPE